ncbi:hypothetical protein ACFY4C_20700 [Actinomadura viridis]|uniref:hypothetical protein n=1 Tax=Actinomadura viridis TaxID=58110 RepID=UPI003687CFF9
MRREILPQATEIGREVGRRIQAGIEREVKPVTVNVGLGQSVARLERLKRLLDEVDGRTVNVQVNVDLGQSLAEVRLLSQLLARLDGRRINIDIDIEIAAALAQIAAASAAVRSIDNRRTINIDVDTSSATSSIGRLRTALIALGLLTSPAIAGISAGLVGLAAPLAAAGVGFGGLAAVAIPAISRIRQATQQQTQASQRAASAAGQAQSRAFAQASAQQQLASAIRNAALAHQQALEQVRNAELQLAQAQQTARRAQEDLNQARFEARRGLEDLSNQVASARLNERQAVFDVQDAERELARLRANPQATQDQIARQQLVADQANQRLTEQRLMLKRLVQDEKAARKAGVEGSDQVRNARDRLADANARITESERALAAARANVARVDQQSADQVASARRALAQASMQAASSTAAMSGPMVQLTALEKQLAAAWRDLTSVFTTWNQSLQPDVIPVLIKGIALLKNILPLLTPVVRGAATAVGQLLDRANAASQSPFWTQFSDFLGRSVGPAITGLGTLAGSLLRAFAGIVQGFMPIGMAFLQVLNTIMARFAAFTTGLTSNPAFQQFVQQFTAAIPILVETFSAIGSLVGSLFAALAPAMAPVLEFIRSLAANLAAVLRSVGPAIQSVFGALGPALSAVLTALAPVVAQLVQALAPLLVQLINGLQPILIALVPVIDAVIRALAPVISALIAGLQPAIASLVPVVGLLVGAIGQILLALSPILPVLGRFIADLVTGLMPVLTPIINAIALMASQIAGALVEALRQSLPALQEALIAIAGLLPALLPVLPLFTQWLTAILPLVPTLVQLASVLITALVPVLRLAITIVVTYWRVIASLLLPVLRLLVSVVQWVVGILTPVIQGIGWVIRGLGTAAAWLWTRAIAPAFRGIATVAKWLYSFIAVVLIAPLILQFKIVAGIVKWLWNSVIAPAFRGIGTVIRWAYNTFIRPVLNMFVTVMRTYVAPAVRWLYNTIIRPVWNAIGSSIRYVWNTFIRPTFDGIKSAVGKLGGAFKVGVDAIRKAWDKLKDAAKAPVSFVVNTVFNKGIVGVWNAVAALVPGVGKLDPIRGFNTGGIYPGYTPGRDIGLIGVSGGEAIMRPEWTRAVGPGFVDAANAAARRGGVGAAARFMTGAFGGNFFLGGVVDKFKNAAKGLFADGLKKSAQRVFGPLLALSDKTTGGMGAFGKLVSAIPHALISKIMNYFGPLEAKIGGDAKGVVAAARRYIGVGDDRGMDNNNRFTRQWGWPAGTPWCALFVSTAVKDAKAGKFYPGYPTAAVATFNARMKHISTSAGRPGDLATYGSNSHVNLIEKPLGGSTYRTIGGNEGPKVKRGTRSNPATVLRPGFALGGVIDPKVFGQRNFDPADRTAPLTSMYRELAKGTLTFDSGGWLPTGTSLVYNGTGAPEPVLTDAQWSKLSGNTRGGDGPRIGTLMNVEHQHIHDTVDVDSVAQRLDFAARASTFGE